MLDLLPSEAVIRDCLANLVVEGRFQQLSSKPMVYTDVAHNAESARYLAKKLANLQDQGFKVHALVAMLADKDKVAVLNEVSPVVDAWCLAGLNCFRGDKVENLAKSMDNVHTSAPIEKYQTVADALDGVLPQLDEKTVLIIFGSFLTVAAAINYWKK